MTRVFKLGRRFGDWEPGTYVLAANAEDPASGFVLASATKVDSLFCLSPINAFGLFEPVADAECLNPPARRALLYTMREHADTLTVELQTAQHRVDHLRALSISLAGELRALSMELGDE